MCALLTFKNVNKAFNDAKKENFKVLGDISFALKQGKTISIVGESGSGKSTLVRLICRLDKVSAGSILFEGRDISKLKGNDLKKYRQNVQIIFQETSNAFSKKMRIIDYMIEPHLNFFNTPKTVATRQAKQLLKHVGLDENILMRYSKALSGGQLQRVTIARAIGINPKLIIFDECTSALDVSIQKQVLSLIMALKKEHGFSAIFIT